MVAIFLDFQAINAPGGGIWNDTKDKPETGGPSSWNVDVFVQTVKDLVSVFSRARSMRRATYLLTVMSVWLIVCLLVDS